MKKCAVLALMTASLLAEKWEVKIVRPQETSPARYAQVAEEEIRWLARNDAQRSYQNRWFWFTVSSRIPCHELSGQRLGSQIDGRL
jgi:hypothetical protein